MAENPLLPGTDIEVMEKYAPGKRLDFPSFSSVCKTSFAKGVITDFEKISDDPIMVKSRVKVEIEGVGESDFIPIFFTPKSEYWDGEDGVLATDFDEETGAFKQAWMSFRCGDEVAVMLKEDVPVAVMGFADGVPRVGEDIIKVVAPTYEGLDRFFHLQCSRFKVDPNELAEGEEENGGLFGVINEEKYGPDGLDLRLVQEYNCQGVDYYHRPANWNYPDSSGDNQNFGRLVRYSQPAPGGWTLHRTINNIKQRYFEAKVVVGPVLYIFQILSTESHLYQNSYDIGDVVISYHYEPTDGIPLDLGQIIVSGGDCPTMGTGGGIPGTESESSGMFITDIQCRAAIYSEELLKAIEKQGPVSSEQAYKDFSAHGWNYEWGTKYANTVWQREWNTLDLISNLFSYTTWPKWDNTKFLTRPHTKEELTAAGMWPDV